MNSGRMPLIRLGPPPQYGCATLTGGPQRRPAEVTMPGERPAIETESVCGRVLKVLRGGPRDTRGGASGVQVDTGVTSSRCSLVSGGGGVVDIRSGISLSAHLSMVCMLESVSEGPGMAEEDTGCLPPPSNTWASCVSSSWPQSKQLLTSSPNSSPALSGDALEKNENIKDYIVYLLLGPSIVSSVQLTIK